MSRIIAPRLLRSMSLTFGALGALASAPGTLLAGPINPPPGPVAPTHKTLTEVEPRVAINAANTPGDADSVFRITQPGSYYLAGNLVGQPGKHGIEIATSGVTIDLAGFEVRGIGGALDGIAATAGGSELCIRNGTVRLWPGDGIDLQTSFTFNTRVEGVMASTNAGFGVRVANGFTVTGCGAYFNSAGGFQAVNHGLISRCTALSNSNGGIHAGQGVTVELCTSSFNSGTAAGITTGGFGGMVSRCAASGNDGDGIRTDRYTQVLDCTATSNDGFGIVTHRSCMVARCTVVFSQMAGISVDEGSSVLDSTVSTSFRDGVRCTADCLVRGNTCTRNSNGAPDGVNIRVTGSKNRIEANHCTEASRGIQVEAAGNLIVRNTCSQNTTNWQVVAGNVCLVVQGVTGGAILGSAGGAAPGSTDPSANFSY